MPTKVYTEVSCQGCGKMNRREDLHLSPPPAWMEGSLGIYDDAAEVRQEVFVDALCVSCGDAVLAVVGVKRKRQRRERDSQTAISVSRPAQPPPDTHEQVTDPGGQVAIPCPHNIETPHEHTEKGDEITCVEPKSGWPAKASAP